MRWPVAEKIESRKNFSTPVSPVKIPLAAKPATMAPNASTPSGTVITGGDLVRVLERVMVGARSAVEGHEDQPPAIERGERGRDHNEPERVTGGGVVAGESRLDDRVLGEEAGGQRKSGERERADQHHRVGDRDHACASPPMRRMSCSWCMAVITEPAPRNSSALKKAWVNRWNMPTE